MSKPRYKLSFRARLIGALGWNVACTEYADTNDLEEIRRKLYEKYENVGHIQIHDTLTVPCVAKDRMAASIQELQKNPRDYPGLAWGDSSPAEIISQIQGLPEPRPGKVSLHILLTTLRSFETHKMIGHANRAIDYLVRCAKTYQTLE